MDLTKWKTVAIRIEDFYLLKGICEKKYRKPASMISKLIHDYCVHMSKKEQVKLEVLKEILSKDLPNNKKEKKWVLLNLKTQVTIIYKELNF